MNAKIKNDTFRTMTTDAEFLEQVSEDMLIRTLNAFVRISLPGGKGKEIGSDLYSPCSFDR